MLSVAFVLALISSFIVHPDSAWLAYPDYRTLALLFCLMIIVAGLQHLGVFALLGQTLIKKGPQPAHALRHHDPALLFLQHDHHQRRQPHHLRSLYYPRFPYGRARRPRAQAHRSRDHRRQPGQHGHPIAIRKISISTPSPKCPSEISPGPSGHTPPSPSSCSSSASAACAKRPSPTVSPATNRAPRSRRRKTSVAPCCPFLALLALCLLVVFRVLPYGPVLLIVVAVIFVVDRRLFRQVDYGLLATFLCFFVFIGNVGRIPRPSAPSSSPS